jgi:hypothetical protein
MGTLTTPTQKPGANDDQTESIALSPSEVISMNGQTPASDPTNIPGVVTLKELNESRPVTQMTIDDYRRLSQDDRDNLSGNYIEFPTAKTPVPALLAPIWGTLTPEQQTRYAGDLNSQTNLRITQYPSNQRIAENQQRHADYRNQQQVQNPNPVSQPAMQLANTRADVQSVEPPKTETARVESLTREYVNSVYSKFRGTDPKAPASELYKSLKNATDPEIIKIRELLYGKTDGGQDNDSGLYDVFRNGKESAETVMKRLKNVPGATTEEKIKYLEAAIEKVKKYKEDFGKPKPPVQPAPKPTTLPGTPPLDSGTVPPNVSVQDPVVPQKKNVPFNPADTSDVIARLQTGELLPVKTVEEMKVALSALKQAGETDWYEYLQLQAKVRFGKEIE